MLKRHILLQFIFDRYHLLLMGSQLRCLGGVNVETDVMVFKNSWTAGRVVGTQELGCKIHWVASIREALKPNIDDCKVRHCDRLKMASDRGWFNTSGTPSPHLAFDDESLS